jgi:hypothetical protein
VCNTDGKKGIPPPGKYRRRDRLAVSVSPFLAPRRATHPVLRAVGWIARKTGVTVIGLGIATCAVVAPLVALRAATWAGRAADADQSSLQSLELREERFSQALAKLNQDARIFANYAELSNGVAVLNAQAARVRHTAPATALRLHRQAQVRRSLAAGLRQSMRTTALVQSDGKAPRFAFAAGLAGLLARDAELQSIESTADKLKASHARARMRHLTLGTVVWGAGLVFFTFAHVARRRNRPRRIFSSAGVLMVILGGLLPVVYLAW